MTYIGVKAKIKTELMSKQALIRLNQNLNRDSRAIRDYLNIITSVQHSKLLNERSLGKAATSG